MTARSQFIRVVSSAWQEVVKNMLRIGVKTVLLSCLKQCNFVSFVIISKTLTQLRSLHIAGYVLCIKFYVIAICSF